MAPLPAAGTFASVVFSGTVTGWYRWYLGVGDIGGTVGGIGGTVGGNGGTVGGIGGIVGGIVGGI